MNEYNELNEMISKLSDIEFDMDYLAMDMKNEEQQKLVLAAIDCVEDAIKYLREVKE